MCIRDSTDAIQNRYIFSTGAKMLGLAILLTACAIGAGFCLARMGAGVGRDLRHAVFERVTHFNNAEMDQFSTASLITRTTNDITQVQAFLSMGPVSYTHLAHTQKAHGIGCKTEQRVKHFEETVHKDLAHGLLHRFALDARTDELGEVNAQERHHQAQHIKYGSADKRDVVPQRQFHQRGQQAEIEHQARDAIDRKMCIRDRYRCF